MSERAGGAPEVVLSAVRSRRLRISNRLLRWAGTNSRQYEWREPGRSPYQILVAELLLKRTTSTAAARVYSDFLARFPSMSDICRADEREIEGLLAGIGLHKQRARGMKAMAEYVHAEHGGALPGNLRGLERVPHIGPYAARAVASFALDRPAAVVDSNVERIVRRLFAGSLGSNPRKGLLQDVADVLLSRRYHREFNLGLLDLGAKVCRYVRPKCVECPLRDVCDYSQVIAGNLAE